MTDWYPVPGFPSYQVTLDGRVRHVREVVPFVVDAGRLVFHAYARVGNRRIKRKIGIKLLTESLARSSVPAVTKETPR